MKDITIEKIYAGSEEAQELIGKLDELLYERYHYLIEEAGDEYDMEMYLDDWTELDKPNVVFLGARNKSGDLVGMGAIKNLDGYSELKRVYVEPWYRGEGVSGMLIKHLELHSEYDIIRLETGTEQPEAVKFFWSYGYEKREPYGDYPDHPASIFMEKTLTKEK
jgi:putative acetyltransferase